MPLKKFIYLASPYSHKDKRYKERRFRKVCTKAADLMLEGYLVFCPIAHSHPIEWHGMEEKQSGAFWLRQDFAILKFCDELWVFKMKGWKDSSGIQQEIEFAKKHNIIIRYIKC